MKQNLIRTSIALPLIALLSACGSSNETSTPSIAAAMPATGSETVTTPVTTAPLATTPVATVPVTTSPVTASPVETMPVETMPVAAIPVATTPVATTPVASVPVALATDTDTLSVPEDFSFDSARTIDIEFDLEQARGQDASVSICTRYAQDGNAFDVDYTSCAVRGPMVDGVFNHSMEITNEFDSVIAVVWFQDSSIEPLHRIFTIDQPVAKTSDRGVRSVKKQARVIVWK